ncbi:MAG: hypothetical protein LBI05_07165, partial [Planctomycetaceae bacterium]|nr:hypothetical protein [Planctomycetaceae bacterium]
MLSNPDAIRREILKIVAQPNYRPQKPKKFLTALGLTSDDAREVRMLIREMVDNGELAFGQGHFVLPVVVKDGNKDGRRQTADSSRGGRGGVAARVLPSEKIIIGRFQRRTSGIGFVRPRSDSEETTRGQDIFIPAFWTKDAASGDTVAVMLMEQRPKDEYGKHTKRRREQTDDLDERGPRGRVVEIVERASNRFVGTYTIENGWGYVQIDGSIHKRNVPVGDASASSARSGDKIVVEMISFPTLNNDGEAVIVEVLGAHGVPGLDTLLILRQFDLPEQFADDTLKAARNEVEKFFKLIPDDTAEQ